MTATQVKIWFQNHRYKCKRQEKEKEKTISLHNSLGNCTSSVRNQFNSLTNPINLMHHNQFQTSNLNLNSCSTNSDTKYRLCSNNGQLNTNLTDQHNNDTNIDSPTPSLSPKKINLKENLKCKYVSFNSDFFFFFLNFIECEKF